MHSAKQLHETSPYLVLGLIILTFGLYIFAWIYWKNEELKLIKETELDSNRGILVLFFLPIIFALIHWILNLTFPGIIFISLFYLIEAFLIFAALKYLYEFCREFSKQTRTSMALWFLPFCIFIIGIVLLIFQILVGIPLVGLLLLHIPNLQSIINVHYNKIKYREEKKSLFN